MQEEMEANLFCAELLIPDSIVSEMGYEDPEALSSELEIPRELAELKLSSLHGD
jgi:Zn-dependent peptidase ImmA (M78 family)